MMIMISPLKRSNPTTLSFFMVLDPFLEARLLLSFPVASVS
jgi:hypothetical protein